MTKFKVTLTLTTTTFISKSIEANDLKDAMSNILKSAKEKDWITKSELKASAK